MMQFLGLYQGRIHHHTKRALSHLRDGNEEYAAGSLRKVRKFWLRQGWLEGHYNIDIPHFDRSMAAMYERLGIPSRLWPSEPIGANKPVFARG